MGLLDRAGGRLDGPAIHAPAGPGLLRRARGALLPRAPRPPAQASLLRKASGMAPARPSTVIREGSELSYPEFDLDEATEAMDAIPLSAEYPIKLFELLQDILAVSSGGLFFLDQKEGLYAPLALAGFDQTTRHRLRLPLSLVSSTVPSAPELISGTALEPFKMFFSSQGYRRLAALRLIPLDFTDSSQEARKALILAAESSIPRGSAPVPEDWGRLSPFLAERVGVWASRFGKSFTGISLPASLPDAEGKSLDEALQDASKRGLKTAFIVLPLEEALSALERANPQADRYRLFAEARAFISGMIAPPGIVLPLRRYRLGILFARPSPPDAELILHQMRSPLLKVFPSLSGMALLPEAVIDPLAEPEEFHRLTASAVGTQASADGA